MKVKVPVTPDTMINGNLINKHLPMKSLAIISLGAQKNTASFSQTFYIFVLLSLIL